MKRFKVLSARFRLYGDVYVRTARFRLRNPMIFRERSPYRLVIVEPLSIRVVPIHRRGELHVPYYGVSFLMHGFHAPAITRTFHACLERSICGSHPFCTRTWLFERSRFEETISEISI